MKQSAASVFTRVLGVSTPGLVLGAVAVVASAHMAGAGGVVGTGTAGSCTDEVLNAALAGGGLVTFNCGSAAVTIDISTGTGTKTIAADTTIDGGSLITISGGHSVGVFSVGTGVKFAVQNLTIANGNSATTGGGIYNGGTLTVTNSTFSGNGATYGSAIYCSGLSTLTVTNSTFSGNSATHAGAITNGGTAAMTVTNTIVANSTSGGNCAGAVTDGGHNIDDGTTCGFRGIGCTSTGGTSFCNTTPQFDPAGLANNGGPTQTIALQAGSPAINAGDEALCAAPPVNNLDQRGFVRPGAGATNCSIGAFEANASPATNTPTPTFTETVTPTRTFTATATSTPSQTFTATPSMTSTRTSTATPTVIPTSTATMTATAAPTFTATQTPTWTDTSTVTATVTPTRTPTASASPTGTSSYTVTATPTDSPTPTATSTATATASPTSIPCVGDCNGDRSVTVDELLTMVSIALGEVDISSCSAGIATGVTQITVDQILTAVSNALNGCGGG